MPQQIIISEQLRIAALLTDERVDELIVAQGHHQIGDVYVGTVENVLPGIDAAFVKIGDSEKNGFIHVNDLGPLRRKKTSAGITELLDFEQKVLVQVIKEPTGNKGPRLTGNLALPGRYLVLQPHGQGVNISRRINNEGERNRLRALGVLIKPPGTGLLIRTEANSVNEELLIDDLESLLKQWEAIQQSAEACSPPCLLNRDEDFIHRILRDHNSSNLERIIVEDSSGVDRVQEFLNENPAQVIVKAHTEPNDLLKYYKIDLAIHNALQPRVELPSGGYIIIEPTEALTVIDVNSGSGTRSNARETVLWTNCEAAKEIARQLKLRNIGGVIIVDFIDMDSRKDQLQLLEHFSSSIKDDSARPQIAQLTELGLVELTRKRQGQNIYELFGKGCPNGYGEGHVAVMPQKDSAQSFINQSTSIQSSPSTHREVSSSNEEIIERNSVNNKVNNNELSTLFASSTKIANYDFTQSLSDGNNEDDSNANEILHKKEKPELIAVPMDSDEEHVYSSMGLNPTLLLEKAPINENLIIHVIRPGEDAEEIIQEAQQQLTTNSGRKRKKSKHTSRNFQKSVTDENSSIINEETETPEITLTNDENLQRQFEEEVIEEEVSSITPEEVVEDPRRRRRRSSATN